MMTDSEPEEIFTNSVHGLWCPNCGDLVYPDWADGPAPESCRARGFPEITQEWIEANV